MILLYLQAYYYFLDDVFRFFSYVSLSVFAYALKEMFGVGVELDIGQLFELGVLQYVFPKCFQFEKNDHKSRTGRIVGIRSFSLQLHFHRFHLGHAKYKLNLVNTR